MSKRGLSRRVTFIAPAIMVAAFLGFAAKDALRHGP
jgi:hypothetical protein